jgi:hypothetical protein
LELGSERKDVVPDLIVLSEVLKESSGRCALDEIPLEDDIGRALVRVQTPAAVAERLDVMDVIIVHNRAGLHTECVDPAHIRGHTLTDGVYVVEANVIVMRITATVTPGPAYRDAGLIEIKNVIVLDYVVRRLSNPDTDRSRMQASAVGDETIPNDVVGYMRVWID